jgi:hypothetical protein
MIEFQEIIPIMFTFTNKNSCNTGVTNNLRRLNQHKEP